MNKCFLLQLKIERLYPRVASLSLLKNQWSLTPLIVDDEAIGQQTYAKMLAAQLSLMPTNGATIGVTNSNVVSPEKYAQNGQNALAAGYVIGTLGGAAAIGGQVIPLGNAIVASTATNAGINVYNQLNDYGEIKYPVELAINSGFGVLEGVLGRYSGSGWRGIATEAVIGASSNVAATYTVNNYYQDADHQDSLVTQGEIGAGFGAGVKALEERRIIFKPLEPYLSPYFRNLIWK